MLKIIMLFAVSAAVLLASVQCDGVGMVRLSEAEINVKLFALKPLPKVHYFWPIAPELLNDRNNRRLYELARITHSLCVSGEWVTKQQIDNCVYTCARVNRTGPSIKASLGVNFSPWHRKFGKKLPPTDRGPTYREEIYYFEERMRSVRQWLEQSNKKYKSNVKIGAITLDSERFQKKAADKVWNEGMREALDAIHIKARSILPGARIEWYGRGMLQVSRGDGWDKTPYWTGKEIKGPLSCSLYTVPEIERTRETFHRTCKLADQMGISDVTPWVALAAGYRRGLTKSRYWDKDWSYDIMYSYLIGAELNIKWYGDRPERFAPYNRAKVIVFYPPPFDKRAQDWAKHFIAYVRGATGVKELRDLGYEE
jgi:hypothetical protein